MLMRVYGVTGGAENGNLFVSFVQGLDQSLGQLVVPLHRGLLSLMRLRVEDLCLHHCDGGRQRSRSVRGQRLRDQRRRSRQRTDNPLSCESGASHQALGEAMVEVSPQCMLGRVIQHADELSLTQALG